jgi:hypothetical protein
MRQGDLSSHRSAAVPSHSPKVGAADPLLLRLHAEVQQLERSVIMAQIKSPIDGEDVTEADGDVTLGVLQSVLHERDILYNTISAISQSVVCRTEACPLLRELQAILSAQ